MVKETLLKSLKTAISKVLETMFFQPVIIRENPGPVAEWFSKDQPFHGAKLGFGGPISGICYILIGTDNVMEMTSNFLGVNTDEVVDDQAKDTVKEALNMIGGHMLSLCDNTGAFKLGIPELVDKDDSILEKLEDSNDDILQVETGVACMVAGLVMI